MKKSLIKRGVPSVLGMVCSAFLFSCTSKPPSPQHSPPLKVQAVQIKEAVMSDVIALKGILQRRKDFIVVLNAGSEYAGKCKKGLEALVRIEGHPTAYKGKVSMVSQSGSGYRVEIPLTRAPASLRIGTPVQAAIYGNTASTALIVPWAAVNRDRGICVWLVDPDKKAKRIPVNLGSYDDNLVAISGDVKKDDWVILSPHNALSDNRDLDVSEIY
jgi:hypothetical protein